MTVSSTLNACRRRTALRLLALLLGVLGVAGGPLPHAAAAEPVLRDVERAVVQQVNAERRAAGRPPLRETLQLSRHARGWSSAMSRHGRLRHQRVLGMLVQGPWERLDENVGYVEDTGIAPLAQARRITDAFAGSPRHRGRLLADVNQVGVGAARAADGSLWLTVDFLRGPVGAFPLFPDVAGTHLAGVEALWAHGVTAGCGSGGAYCPAKPVTREQLASFLARALGLTPIPGDRFGDVAGVHEANVNALAAAGVAAGYPDGGFRPGQPVTRAQMATFLARARRLPPAGGNAFGDVAAGDVHAPAVAALAQAGITRGCAPGRYCPADAVRRDQMASFVARAFDLAP